MDAVFFSIFLFFYELRGQLQREKKNTILYNIQTLGHSTFFGLQEHGIAFLWHDSPASQKSAMCPKMKYFASKTGNCPNFSITIDSLNHNGSSKLRKGDNYVQRAHGCQHRQITFYLNKIGSLPKHNCASRRRDVRRGC